MTSHQNTKDSISFNLAHAREEAKNEVRSKIVIYDQPLKCTWSIYIVHVVNINITFFYELVLRQATCIPQAYQTTEQSDHTNFLQISLDLKSSSILF